MCFWGRLIQVQLLLLLIHCDQPFRTRVTIGQGSRHSPKTRHPGPGISILLKSFPTKHLPHPHHQPSLPLVSMECFLLNIPPKKSINAERKKQYTWIPAGVYPALDAGRE